MLNGPVYIPKLYDGRDRTFFLFSWESLREINGQSSLTVTPTALERLGDFSQTLDANGKTIPIKDPLATGSCTATSSAACFPGNRIPSNRLSPVALNLLPY